MGTTDEQKSEQEEFFCKAHVTDKALADLLEPAGTKLCMFCDSKAKAFSLSDLINAVEDAVGSQYQSAADALCSWDSETGAYDDPKVRESSDVVYEICQDAIDSAYVGDCVALIAGYLPNSEWAPSRNGDNSEHLQSVWNQFVEYVKTTSRFVFLEENSPPNNSPAAKSVELLMGLRSFLDPAHGLVYTVEPGTEFFRGRLEASREEAEKLLNAKSLGPAPINKAESNRMSPAGIPMFYASKHPETAVSEIASHDTKTFARIGTFKNQEPLRVLDLTKPPSPFSPFDVKNRNRNGLRSFLRDFAANVAKPIIPDGRPHVEYVPTQIITELFRWAPGDKLDGIKIRSAQDHQDTFVFFYDAKYVYNEGETWTGFMPDYLDDLMPEYPGLILPRPGPVFTLDLQSVKTYEIKKEN